MEVERLLNHQDKLIKTLERALYNLASAVPKDSCVYCPIEAGGGERCDKKICENCKEHKARCAIYCNKIIHVDSEECIDKIVVFYIKQAEKELKGSKYGNKEIEQI